MALFVLSVAQFSTHKLPLLKRKYFFPRARVKIVLTNTSQDRAPYEFNFALWLFDPPPSLVHEPIVGHARLALRAGVRVQEAWKEGKEWEVKVGYVVDVRIRRLDKTNVTSDQTFDKKCIKLVIGSFSSSMI